MNAANSFYPKKNNNFSSGTLFIVSTPIGNLQDITLRALEILRKVNIIAAEDTRRTRKLTSWYQISTPLISYHEHNKRQRGEYLLSLLQRGKNIALVSDAGTPGISDPGSHLILEALKKEIPVMPVPGPSALITALIVSGLPTQNFVFEGFLPRTRKKRCEKLETLRKEARTVILFEAPQRLINTLKEIYQLWGERKAAVARELTKKFEEVRRGRIGELLTYYQNHPPRGEICLIIEGKMEEPSSPLSLKEQILNLLQEGFSIRETTKIIAQNRKVPRKKVYRLAVELKNNMKHESSG